MYPSFSEDDKIIMVDLLNSLEENDAKKKKKWTKEEDLIFEQTLISYPEGVPDDQWEKIAAEIPGKSPAEVEEHYKALVHDLAAIELGFVKLPNYSDDYRSPTPTNQVPPANAGPKWVDASSRSRIFIQHKWPSSAPELRDLDSPPLPATELRVLDSPPLPAPSKIRPVPKKKRPPSSSWTTLEHRLFLIGLREFGKGKWKKIAEFVGTKYQSQVSSHAQKYFERQNDLNKNMKRKSIHDLTIDDIDSEPYPVGPKNWLPPLDLSQQQLQQMLQKLDSLQMQQTQLQQLNSTNNLPSQSSQLEHFNHGL